MILITGRQNNFRRAGLAHPAKPTEYADDFFSEAQIKAITEEPMLTIERVDGDVKGTIMDDPFAAASELAELFEIAIGNFPDDKSDQEYWTRSGAPQLAALEKVMGVQITASMRDIAYKNYLEESK